MTKLPIIALLFLIHSLSATDKKVDEILHKIFPAGDDHHPMLEDPAKVKEFCEKKPYNEFNEYLGHLKGLTHKLAEILLNVLQPPFLCGAIKGDYKKWTQLGVTMNKHKEDIKKARYGLLAALHNAGKDGKCTIPELGCYIKQYTHKLLEAVKDDPESTKLIEEFAKGSVAEVAKIIEAEKGKIPDNCKLPETNTKVGEYDSMVTAFICALKHLDK